MSQPVTILTDLEGVWIPEVWIAVAKETGIDELLLTTRDEPNYDKLMKNRIKILRKNNITLKDIQTVIQTMDLLPGAKEAMDKLRSRYQLIILSDTFYEFAKPFMEKLNWPTLLCHSFEVDDGVLITDYKLRMDDGKRQAAKAMKSLNYKVIGIGDSYNDTKMLKEADHGILVHPPQNVIEEFPQFPVANDYSTLEHLIDEFSESYIIPYDL